MCNIFCCQIDEAKQDPLQNPWEKRVLIFFSLGSLDQVRPINVKREIRGLCEVKKKKTKLSGPALKENTHISLINLLAR